MDKFFKAIPVAYQNIKGNPLHTLLSTLGIIIGVAALVAILSLGDGLEQTGREQIESTTSVQMMKIDSRRWNIINDVRVPRDTVFQFTIEDARKVEEKIKGRGYIEMITQQAAKFSFQDSTVATYIYGTLDNAAQIFEMNKTGSFISKTDIEEHRNVAILSDKFASKWNKDYKELLGSNVLISGHNYKIIGIIESTTQNFNVIIPISAFLNNIPGKHYPYLVIKADKVEDLLEMRRDVEGWLDQNFKDGKEAFSVFTYEDRVQQLSQGIFIFKMVMGAITGISVLVGGIGIMNVLLISVTERTKEIGIRKATGARKSDIVFQFILESITISVMGGIIGWILGVLGVFGTVEIITRFTEMNFQAAISLGSILVVLLVALFVGVLFGTYPAWKAANLSPVDAIRHE